MNAGTDTTAQLPAARSSSEPPNAEAELTEAPTKKAAKPTETAEPQPTKQAPKMTPQQQEAIEAAERYLDTRHLSKKALFDQLTSEYGGQFSKAEATFALDHVDADYYAEAVEAAESYPDTMSFSKKALTDQLTSEYRGQFTEDRAQVRRQEGRALMPVKTASQQMSELKEAVEEMAALCTQLTELMTAQAAEIEDLEAKLAVTPGVFARSRQLSARMP